LNRLHDDCRKWAEHAICVFALTDDKAWIYEIKQKSAHRQRAYRIYES